VRFNHQDILVHRAFDKRRPLGYFNAIAMSLKNPFTQSAMRAPEDESDAEEDALVNDYKEQVRYDHEGLEEMEKTSNAVIHGGHDIAAQAAAAATPLEYQATLEAKFASYDNYCSLFHYILNSEGPVDLEVPSVCPMFVERHC
jgi:RNA polymerase I-associated factor PAF67